MRARLEGSAAVARPSSVSQASLPQSRPIGGSSQQRMAGSYSARPASYLQSQAAPPAAAVAAARPPQQLQSAAVEYDDGAGVLTPNSRKQEEARRLSEGQGQAAAGGTVAATGAGPSPQSTGSRGAGPSDGSLLALGVATRDGLNEAQMQAASHAPCSALIIFAPAGAGKTLTLVHRVFFLCGSGGLVPSQVLCLTFTRKAAVEIRGRLHQAAGMVDVECATFHGWCLRLLRTFAHLTGRRPDFRLASHAQQLGLLKEAVYAWQRQQGISPPDDADAEAEAAGGAGGGGRGAGAGPVVGRGATPITTPRHATPHGSVLPSGLTCRRASDATTMLCRKLQKAFRDVKLLGHQVGEQTNALLMSEMGQFVLVQYDEQMRRCGLVDLGDLQSIAIELLGHAPVLESLRRKYRHVLVDEYQDTNKQQLQIIKLLCGVQPAPKPEGRRDDLRGESRAPKPDGRRETLDGSRMRPPAMALAPHGPLAVPPPPGPPPPEAPPPPPQPQPPPTAAPPSQPAMGVTVVGDDDQSIYSFRGAQPCDCLPHQVPS